MTRGVNCLSKQHRRSAKSRAHEQISFFFQKIFQGKGSFSVTVSNHRHFPFLYSLLPKYHIQVHKTLRIDSSDSEFNHQALKVGWGANNQKQLRKKKHYFINGLLLFNVSCSLTFFLPFTFSYFFYAFSQHEQFSKLFSLISLYPLFNTRKLENFKHRPAH